MGLVLGGLASFFLAGELAAQEPEEACPPRQANTTLALPSRLPVMGYGVVEAFPGLRFVNPVAIASPPGETNRLFVAERGGEIHVIPDLRSPTRELFMDLTARTESKDLEAGLLGLVFHPGFRTNGYFFVYRTLYTNSVGYANMLHDRVSRFSVLPGEPNQGDTNSELPIISQVDAEVIHNAGDLQFGPDGYLYVSMGDSGPPKGALGLKSQTLDEHYSGCILRIDVDKRPGNLTPNPHAGGTENYLVPADNPFVGRTQYFGQPLDVVRLRTEIFALGFRNPWRFTFHPETGDLYCADVGDANWEEVNYVEPGGNYGWPYYEARNLMPNAPARPPGFATEFPIIVIQQGSALHQGSAVIGGLFYQGNALPNLRGKYIFGDYAKGHIWASGIESITPSIEWLTGTRWISTFGVDPRDGEVLVADHKYGVIRKLVYAAATSSGFPAALSQTGAFADLDQLIPQAGIEPYDINVPFWSDRAIKRRWFSLPSLSETFKFARGSNWEFPERSVWIKHFDLEMETGRPESRRKLETRFLVKTADGAYGVTYRWPEGGRDAFLVNPGGWDEYLTIQEGNNTRRQLWRYPSHLECMTCHTPGAGWALGFTTSQLNREVTCGGGAVNQIDKLWDMGYLRGERSAPEQLLALAPANAADAPLEHRARSYMAANCGQCHRPGEDGGEFWDGRPEISLAETRLLEHAVRAGSPVDSPIMLRLSQNGILRMPPLGSTELDTGAIALIRNWIGAFPPAPWIREDIGNSAAGGSSTLQGGVFEVAGHGELPGPEGDAFHFVHRELPQYGHMVARMRGWFGTPAGTAGLMLRRSMAADAPFFFVGAVPGGAVQTFYRARTGEAATTVSTVKSSPNDLWVRMVRSGTNAFMSFSANGLSWVRLPGIPWPAGTARAGLAIAAGPGQPQAAARFDSVQTTSVELTLPKPGATVYLPGAITLQASVQGDTNSVRRITFYNGGQKIADVSEAPYQVVWTNPPAGTPSIVARVTDGLGLTFESATVGMTVIAPPPAGAITETERGLRGDWPEHYGSQGFVLFGGQTNLPSLLALTPPGSARQEWPELIGDRRAPLLPDRSARVAIGYATSPEITLELNFSDPETHRVTLYLVDWNRSQASITLFIESGTTGQILDSQTMSGFEEGAYVSFNLRGQVRLRLRASQAPGPVLAGLFLDREIPPAIDLLSPVDGLMTHMDQPLWLAADLSANPSGVRRVEYFVNGQIAATVTTPPFATFFRVPEPGSYRVFARVETDRLGVADSERANVTVAPGQGAAELISVDTATSGNWKGRWGRQGYFLVGSHANLPPTIIVTNYPQTFHVWEDKTEDTRAPEDSGAEGEPRVAATWAAPDSVAFDVIFRDHATHLVSLYLLDYNSGSRRVRVEALEGGSGVLLSSTIAEDLYRGKYYTYRVRGQVRFRVSAVTDFSLMSGIFFDAGAGVPPEIQLVEPAHDLVLRQPSVLDLEAAVQARHAIQRVEFLLDTTPFAQVSEAPYRVQLPSIPAGTHQLRARVVDVEGSSALSDPVRVVAFKPGTAAWFMGTDGRTSGAWTNAYGSEGAMLAGLWTNLPAHVSARIIAPGTIVWAEETAEARALANPANGGRSASAQYAPYSFEIPITVAHEESRLISFYFVDWDSDRRAMRIEVFDTATGALLDARDVRKFVQGVYASWNVAGAVTFRFTSLDYTANAIINGLFIDPAAAPMAAWHRLQFEAADADGDPLADPDGDGRRNLAEYLAGSDPWASDALPAASFFIAGDRLDILYHESWDAWDYAFEPQVSTDLIRWDAAYDRFTKIWLGDLTDGTMWLLRSERQAGGAPNEFFRLVPRALLP